MSGIAPQSSVVSSTAEHLDVELFDAIEWFEENEDREAELNELNEVWLMAEDVRDEWLKDDGLKDEALNDEVGLLNAPEDTL